MTDPRRVLRAASLAAGALLLLAGCADRPLTPRPDPAPGTTTWVGVWSAASLATLVVATLVMVVACGGQRRPGPATLVLAAQAAVAWVLLVVGGGVLLRGLQLVDDPVESRPVTLLRLPGPDGDARLYVLLLLALVIVVGLPAVLLTLAARFSVSAVATDRWLAFVVLAAEVVLAGFAAAVLLLDLSRTWPVAALAANGLPSLAAAVAAWPSTLSDRSGRRDRPALAAMARSTTTVPRT